MSENQNPNVTPEMQAELDEITKKNAGHIDESDPKPEPAEDEPKDPKDEDPKPVDKPTPPTQQDDPEPEKDTPEEPTEPKDDSEPKDKEPEKKEDKPEDPDNDDDDGEDEDDSDKDPVDPKKPRRPVKYVPLPKHLDEKAKWKKTLEEKDAEIERLSKGKDIDLSKEQKEDLKDAETAEDLEAFITENNLDEDAAKIIRGLGTVLEKRMASKIPKVDLSVLEKAQKDEKERKEQEHFDNEFKSITPTIEKHLGKLTPEQTAKVKAKVDDLAHTKELHQTPLNYIVAGAVDELTELIKDESGEAESEVKGRRTAESGKPGHGKHIQLDAAYFKDKTDFSEMDNLDPAAKKELEKSFDPDTYVRYVAYEGQKDTGVEVNRNGRRIVLK